MNSNHKGHANTTLRGLILPAKWDKDGRVLRIAINTQDENEYIIDYSGRGKELLTHIREMIEIEGKVLQRIGGALYVKVNNYSLIKQPT